MSITRKKTSSGNEKKLNYRINLILLSTSFILLVSNSCFAKSPSKNEDSVTAFFIIIIHIILFVFLGAFFYAFFLKPFIKRKKIENYCAKNKLEYIEESKSLPDNININFIKINSSNNGVGEYVFKNIMHGVKNGLYFILCDFYLSFGHYDGIYIFSPGFPLLIIKKPNMNLPYFFLRTGNDLSRFKEIGTMTAEKNKLNKTDIVKPVYRKHISFYFGKRLEFNEDVEFNNKFVLEVNDIEASKTLFNSNLRNIFKEKAKADYVYEGNGDYFIVTSSKESSCEEMIKFLEENLNLFNFS